MHCCGIARMWKQPKLPSVDEEIKKMWCIQTMEYYSAMRKKGNLAIYGCLVGPGWYYAK